MNILGLTLIPINPYSKLWDYVLKSKKNESLFGVERWFKICLAILLMLQPSTLIRFKWRKVGYVNLTKIIDSWIILKVLILFLILVFDLSFYIGSLIISVIFLVDLYSHHLEQVFIGSKPRSLERSIIFLAVNVVESILAFAIIYLYFGVLIYSDQIVYNWHEAVYFSVVTAATVGYGDIVPSGEIGRLLVIIQILASILFVAVVLANYVGQLSAKKQNN